MVERRQKQDLFTHLMTNLQNPLVLRGEQGIGKTDFLESILKRKAVSDSEMHLIKANSNMSFEQVQAEMMKVFSATYQLDQHHSVAELLALYATEGKRLVLLIDDSESLVAGLMNTLIDYAEQYASLRLVFALTASEYVEKNNIENLESTCQFIDLPGLSVRQTELFIRELIESAKATYDIKDITPAFVHEVCNISKGNPEKIKQLMFSAKKAPINNMFILVGVVFGVIILSVTINYYLWQEPDQEVVAAINETLSNDVPEIKVIPPLYENDAEPVKVQNPLVLEAEIHKNPDLPFFAIEHSEKNHIETIGRDKEDSVDVLPIIKEALGNDESMKAKSVAMNEVQAVIPGRNEVAQKAGDEEWIMAQAKNDYTLQLMVLAKKDKLIAEQKRYLVMGVKTFYRVKQAKNSLSFVLFHGQFTTLAKAKRQMQKLPKELRNSWPRKFGAVQREI